MAVPSADGSPPGELPQVLHLQYTTRQKILRQGGAGARPTGTYRPSTCALGFTFISAWSLTIDATAHTKKQVQNLFASKNISWRCEYATTVCA